MKVRVISATVYELEQEVRTGCFRAALFDRIRVVTLRLPPLRERREDIPALATHFIEICQRRYARSAPELSESWLKHLERREWPGNIRELENLMCSYVVIGPKATLRTEVEAGHIGDLRDTPGADACHALGKLA